MKATVLVVDDEATIRMSLRDLLQDAGYQVQLCASGEEVLELLHNDTSLAERLDAVLLDIWLPGLDGMELLERLQVRQLDVPVVMISGHGTVDLAVKVIKMGAYHFLEKPFSEDALLLTLRHALRQRRLELENRALRAQRTTQQHVEIVGTSPQFCDLMVQVKRAALSDARVLIQGENGTGKEAIAHMLHAYSARHAQHFVELNCAAIPEELIESELFGHEKGAFTGATQSRKGKFDQAHGGTLFLDEIGDMSLKTQAKILRVLQEQRFERVGGTGVISVDVRVLAASNKPLESLIEEHLFRADLYYRLNVVPIEVPPLRVREGDLPLLVTHFLKMFAGHHGQRLKGIAPEAMALLECYHWPGNVRELKNIVERMVIMSPGDDITVADIPPAIIQVVSAGQQDAHEHDASSEASSGGGSDASSDASSVQRLPGWNQPYREAREYFERLYLESHLKAQGGNISRTAEQIGLERSHLHKKIKQLGLKPQAALKSGALDQS